MVCLTVVGLVLLLLCMILFVPIHYEVSGTVTESGELSLKGKITYCLSILKLIFSYQDGQTDMQISLFGFQRKRKKESVGEEILTEEQEADWEVGEKTGISEEDILEECESPKEEILEELQESDETMEILEESLQTDTKEQLKESKFVEEIEPEEEQIEEGSLDKDSSKADFSEKLEEDSQAEKSFKRKTKKKQGKKRKKKEKILKEKVPKEKKESKYNFAFIKQQLTDENNHYVVKKVWVELGYLLKHFGLRKIQTDLVFSAGDPALTGQVLGVLCIMPVLYRYEFGLVPDFDSEEVYLKGEFLAAGRIRLIHVLITALRLILDKKIRLVTKNILLMLK